MRILAIDLGKNKSVACIYEADGCIPRFHKLATGIPAIQQLVQACRPDRCHRDLPGRWLGERPGADRGRGTADCQHFGACLAVE